MTREGVLIVGANQAGVQLACSLRDGGYDAPITLVGAEPHAPYQRPPLSKAYLAGKATAQSLAFRAPEFYADRQIDVVNGERIQKISMDSGSATSESDLTFHFAKLALTVGARPRELAVPGADLAGVHYLRDASDAESLKESLAQSNRVVVIGGGFIGLEAAAVARAAGKTVTVVEAADRLIARAVAPVVSDFYLGAHRARGTEVILGVGVVSLRGVGGRVTGVVLADGTEVPADLVLVGVGVVPRTELAEQLGLEVAGAIVVDEFARTSNPDVVSAGDCTLLPNPVTGLGLIRLESVQNAIEQAKVAANTIRGELTSYSSVPWFWSDQDTMKLQIAGLSAGYDDVVVRGAPDRERFSVLYYRDGQVVAIDSVNSPQDFMAVRRMLTTGGNIDPSSATDADVQLKTLVLQSS